MKENYSQEEVEQLEKDLRDAVKSREPDTYFSLEIPQIQKGFLRVDVFPAEEDKAPEQEAVAESVNEIYEIEIGWEECYSTDSMYSISIYDPEAPSDDPLDIIFE